MTLRYRVTIRTTKPWNHPGFVVRGLSKTAPTIGCTVLTREYTTRTAGEIRDAANERDAALESIEVNPT